MPNLDDERFEIYLKKFRPLAPAPLPMDARLNRPRRLSAVAAWAVAAWAAATAAIAVVAVAILLFPSKRVPPASINGHVATAKQTANSQPLTLGAANRLLANSPSLQAALNALESESVPPAIPKDKQSALKVLAEENLTP